MCFAVFIATIAPQQTSPFIAGHTDLYLEQPDEKQLAALRDKFTLPYIYYVGSSGQCSCYFNFHTDQIDNPEFAGHKASAKALVDLLRRITTDGAVEYYCCWEGDWDEPVEESTTIDVNELSAENYWVLEEREFVRFERV